MTLEERVGDGIVIHHLWMPLNCQSPSKSVVDSQVFNSTVEVIKMNDEPKIRATIQTYFDGMYESSAAKTRAAFHPNAKITGYMENVLHEMTVNAFADWVANLQPSAKERGEPARLDILSIDIAGNTAVAKVRNDFIGLTFMDTLSLLKSEGDWRIYNKLWHVEGPVAAKAVTDLVERQS